MTNPDAIFDVVATPVYAGLAIVLLLSTRKLENWRDGREHRAKPHAFRENGPVKAASDLRRD